MRRRAPRRHPRLLLLGHRRLALHGEAEGPRALPGGASRQPAARGADRGAGRRALDVAPRPSTRARAIFESVGQVPIEVKKEIDGFILNRMQAVLLSEAIRLVGEGYVSAEDLDKTIRDGLGPALGVHGSVRDHRAQCAGRHPRLLRALRRDAAELSSGR